MACCPTDEKIYGYDDSRFEKDVDQNFHCSICYNVLREPRTCRNNEHLFCLACITENLRVNSQTCPECNDHLSVDTLRRARVVNNYLSKLKINCDHASRGCSEFNCLENLETHVANCGYAPVLCSNAECGVVINKQEKDHHETAVCEYRRVKCHDCGQIQEDVGTLNRSLKELNGKVEATTTKMKNNHVEMKKVVGGRLAELNGKVEEVKNNHARLRQDQQEIKKEVKEVKKEVKEVKKEVKEVKKEVKEVKKEVKEVKKEVNEVKKEVKEVKKEVKEVRDEVKGVRENLSKVNKDVDEVKVMMIKVLEKFNMLEQFNKLPSPAEGMLSTPREDILIAGGYESGRSTEIYSWEKNRWFEVSPLNEEHVAASSFIYNGQAFVVGGDTMETLDLNKLPLKWKKYDGQLDSRYTGHQTVVYQQRVIHIGGYVGFVCSDLISELQLTPLVTMKKLCQMPEGRDSHAAEIFEDKVVILGGEDYDCNPLNSVLEFDVKKNECKEMPPFPRPLAEMATIRWRDQAVVLGGRDKKGEVLNDVFMHDCKTGKTTALPSMLEKRKECCGVITGNTIVVMGGRNEEHVSLKSVECFTMGRSTWEYLPDMNYERFGAVAEVLPCTRKYV